jgi:hypothetical protein
MAGYAVKVDFGSDADPEEVQAWFDMLMESMPPGAEGQVVFEPQPVEFEKLNEGHVGRRIKLALPGGVLVEGRFEGSYPAASVGARTVIVDGRAYTASYGVAQVGEWLN